MLCKAGFVAEYLTGRGDALNFSGKFAFSGTPLTTDAAGETGPRSSGGTVIVPDAHLLFSGDYKRVGLDLVLSKDGHEYVVPDYFKGAARASLASPDGAGLSGHLVTALTGEVQVAQLGGANAAAQVIGSVTKLTGSATAIRNGVSIQLNMGDKVNKGDVVQAGADSTLGITFIDGTVFGLSANARMVLNEMVYDPNGSNNSSLLSLVQGTITFVAGETAKKGDMRVDTPVATMGIRGTAVLVEIGFEVQGQGGAPPVKFQVLVEPGGRVGSYVLYSRADPTVIIGTVNTAGQVTSVTGAGDAQTTQAPPLSPEALAIIAPIFQLYFPNVPNFNPRGVAPGGGSPLPGTVPGTDPLPQNFNPFDGLTPEVPRIIPINLPGAPPGTPPILVTLNRPNSPPLIEAAHLAVSQGETVVLSAASIGVIDADSTAFTFRVSGVTHGSFETSTDGVHWAAATSFTSAELGAGHVRFVHDGSRAAPTFSVQADDGAAANNQGNVQAGTVDFTTVNQAPSLTQAVLAVAEGGTVVLTAASVGIGDPDSSAFNFTVSGVTHGVFQTTVDGIHWTVSTTFTSADLNAGHVRFVHDGSEMAPTFSIQADDGATVNHLSNLLPGVVVFTNVNDAPVIGAATTTFTIDVSIGGGAGGGLSSGAAEIAGRPGLITGIGTASGYGALALPAGDDNSSGAIDITSVFGAAGINFFGTNYTSLYINNNGNLTFGSPSGAYTPSSIDAGLNNPIIAAFWGDVDTRSTGHVYYTLDAINGVMTVTWDHVGYFNSHSNLTNSFQIVLLNEGGGNFDIQYRYADIQWTTGDASGGSGGVGGTPARAGYSAGDGVHYYELPQSGDGSALLNLPASTGPAGVAFEVADGAVGPTTLTATGLIDFSDPDLGDIHTASAVASHGTVGTLTLVLLHDTTGTGAGGQFGWTYDADSTAVRTALGEAPTHTLTETFLVTIDDGHGGTVTRAVSVTLNGAGDGPANLNISTAAPAVTTVSGMPGDDILIGSGTAENFVFAPGMGNDTIVNFDNVSPAAHDTIELNHFASVPVGASGEFTETEFAAWLQSGALFQTGNDTLIHLGDDSLILRNVSLTSLHASDFIVHAGPLA